MHEGILEKDAESEALPRSLAGAPLSELFALYHALNTVQSVLDGLLCQPRFQADPMRDLGPNTAGKYLDDICQHVGRTVDAIADHARSLKPGAGTVRDEIILANEVRLFESTEQVAAVATELLWKRH